jgi:DNA-binding NarL/FixJ family response regulator
MRALLVDQPGIVVVGEAGDCGEALTAVRLSLPDILLLDDALPPRDELDPTELVQQASAIRPVHVVALLADEREETVLGALRSGARGLLLKSGPPEQLVEAVCAVAAGHVLIAPPLTGWLLDRLADRLDTGAAPPAQVEQLTQRERQVLELLARGKSSQELASTLGLREVTVRSHVHNVLTKLGLRHRSQAVAFAYQSGLVSPAGAATSTEDGDAG